MQVRPPPDVPHIPSADFQVIQIVIRKTAPFTKIRLAVYNSCLPGISLKKLEERCTKP